MSAEDWRRDREPDLDTIEHRVAKMTPGEWVATSHYIRIPGCDDAYFDDSADALGVATLRNEAAALLAEVRRLREEVAELRMQRAVAEERP